MVYLSGSKKSYRRKEARHAIRRKDIHRAASGDGRPGAESCRNRGVLPLPARLSAMPSATGPTSVNSSRTASPNCASSGSRRVPTDRQAFPPIRYSTTLSVSTRRSLKRQARQNSARRTFCFCRTRSRRDCRLDRGGQSAPRRHLHPGDSRGLPQNRRGPTPRSNSVLTSRRRAPRSRRELVNLPDRRQPDGGSNALASMAVATFRQPSNRMSQPSRV